MSQTPEVDSQEPPSEENAPPKGAMTALFFTALMDLLGFGVIIPAMPFYAKHFSASALAVTLMFSVYSLCQLVAAPVLGIISDRWGRRPVLVYSQLGSVVGYLLLGIATQFEWHSVAFALGLIYLSRFIDGISGGNISTAQAYISDITTPKTRAKGMGLLGAAFGIGFVLGPMIGGLLTGEHDAHISWPAYAAAFLSAVAAMLTIFLLPESHVHKPAEEAEAWLHPGKFLTILRKPAIAQLLLIPTFSMMAFVMMECTMALFLSRPETFSFTTRGVGWYFTFAGVIIVLFQGGLIGRLTKRYGEWPLAITGPILVCGGMICFVITAHHPLLSVLFFGAAINAAGRSLQGPTISSLISRFSSRDEQGAVFGLYHGLSSLARTVGPIVAGALFGWTIAGPYMLAAGITLVVGLWTILLSIEARGREMQASAAAEANVVEPG